jgi:osmotically-inducible protein OsmY
VKRKCIAGTIALGLAVSFGAFSGAALAQDPPPQERSTRDQSTKAPSKPTADDAKNNASDRDLMQRIRKNVVDDKSLSTSAKNVKIIAEHGKITLRGPVETQEEKQAVEKMAADVAGAGNVMNEITIKPARNK